MMSPVSTHIIILKLGHIVQSMGNFLYKYLSTHSIFTAFPTLPKWYSRLYKMVPSIHRSICQSHPHTCLHDGYMDFSLHLVGLIPYKC